MSEYRPLLKTIATTVVMGQTEYKFAPNRRYLLLNIECPEVPTKIVAAVARANRSVYESMVDKYFAGEFHYDSAKINEKEPRVIKYLDQMYNALHPGTPYLMVLTVLEFDN